MNVDNRHFMNIMVEILQEKEKPFFPITNRKISILDVNWAGLTVCASLSIILGILGIWFIIFQWVSFACLVSFYALWVFYKISESNIYKRSMDLSSVFSNKPYLDKLMEVSESSLEIGLIILKNNYLKINNIAVSVFLIFYKMGPFPGILALFIIFFKEDLQVWALVIAYVNMGLLFSMHFSNSRLSCLQYMISLTELALKKKHKEK